jgi:hypothetical protein
MGRDPTRTLDVSYFCPACGRRDLRGGSCDRDRNEMRAIPHEGILGRPIGNYIPVALIGEGGMGAVYRAVQPAIGARVAIKILHSAGDASAAQRFLLEAQSVNRIHHPNVVKVLDAGALDDNRPYLVMEWLDGISLADAINEPLPLGTACTIVASVLDVLALAHAEGIVHRDLKPHNVFLERTGRVVVLDFGIAKVVNADAPVALTQSGVLVGTPSYMAPEQIVQGPIDGRTDVYAMTVVLYELVTGIRAFHSEVTFEILRMQLDSVPRRPRELVAGLPAAIDAVIAKGMAKAPEARYASAAEMAEAVRAAGRNQRDAGVAQLVAEREQRSAHEVPTRVERPGARPPAARRVRKRWPWLVIGTGALATTAAIIASIVSHTTSIRSSETSAVAVAATDAAVAAPDSTLVAQAPVDAPAPPADAAIAVAANKIHDAGVGTARARDARLGARDGGVEPAVTATAAAPLPSNTKFSGHHSAVFHADQWLVEAEVAAKQVALDAVLSRMMTTIGPGGASTTSQGTYEFRSASHPDMSLRVIVTREVTEVLAVAGPPHAAERPPRCTLAALFERARDEVSPQLTSVLVEYVNGAWQVGDPGDRHAIADTCTSDRHGGF